MTTNSTLTTHIIDKLIYCNTFIFVSRCLKEHSLSSRALCHDFGHENLQVRKFHLVVEMDFMTLHRQVWKRNSRFLLYRNPDLGNTIISIGETPTPNRSFR